MKPDEDPLALAQLFACAPVLRQVLQDIVNVALASNIRMVAKQALASLN